MQALKKCISPLYSSVCTPCFLELASRVTFSNITRCNIQLSNYHHTLRTRKSKLKSYRTGGPLPIPPCYIFIACTYTRGLGAFGKVRAVSRPLKIHDPPRRTFRAFGLRVSPVCRCSIPTQFLFFHHRSGRLPSGRAEINIPGKYEGIGK